MTLKSESNMDDVNGDTFLKLLKSNHQSLVFFKFSLLFALVSCVFVVLLLKEISSNATNTQSADAITQLTTQSQQQLMTQQAATVQLKMQRYLSSVLISIFLTLLFAILFAYLFFKESKLKMHSIFQHKTQHLLKTQEDTSHQLKLANVVLEESEEKLSIMLNSMGDAVIATDHFARVTRINKVAQTLTGWPVEEALGRPINDILNCVHAKTRALITLPILETIAQEKISTLPKETLLISRDGHEYLIADSCAPIFNAEKAVQGAVMVFRNVTEQEAVHTKLRASEVLYRDTFDHASIGIAHVDINGQIIRVNHCFCVIAGYSEEELKRHTFQEITHPDDLEKDVAQFELMLAGKSNHYNMEKRYIRKDKSIVWIELSVSCVRKDHGDIAYFIGVVENITKRKKATADSRHFFTLSQELLCIAGFDGYIKDANPIWERILGYTLDELMAIPYLEFVHPDDHAITQAEAVKIAEGYSTSSFENRFVCKNGTILHLLWSVTTDTESQLMYCSARDITERKQYEKNLLTRTNQFKTLLDAAPIGIYLLNQDFKVKHHNRLAVAAFEGKSNLLGLDIKDLLGNIFAENKVDAIIKHFNKTLNTGKPYYAAEFFDKNALTGEIKYWTWQINRIVLTNGENGVVCYFEDVTARVLNQKKIVQDETRFRTLFDRGPVAMYFCDLKGKVQEYNQYAVEIWQTEPSVNDNVSLEDATLENEDFHSRFKFYLPDHRLISFRQHFLLKVLNGSLESLRDQEIIFERADGSQVNVVINIVPITNANGDISGAMLCFFDVTYRKQAEEAMFNYTLKLKEAKAVAEKANAAKSEFLSSMSHELRTPLNAILGFAQLIQAATPVVASTPTASQLASIQQILDAGWYLLDLINEILDLAQIESSKLPLALVPVCLNDVLRECGMLIAPLVHKNAITITFLPLAENTYVQSDRTRLKQIIINLLSNAIKYNKKSGAVTVDFSVKNDSININVRDTGIGLDEHQLSHLFEPFNRLGQDLTGEEGSGIGLMVSKKLVELMHGELGVYSKKGHGSVFWFSLTLISPPHLLKAPSLIIHQNVDKNVEVTAFDRTNLIERPVDAKPSIHKLLYIEDNHANFAFIAEALAFRPDIHLHGAENGAQGLKMASTWLPHVILLDINLPDMSGFEVLKILAKNAGTARIPVIAISANAMLVDIQSALEAGFYSYLTKPIKLDELMESLAQAFEYSTKLDS